ncbi:MAG: SRPBCC family protein [Burkholderiales bacterium]|nr:SRPBCC family protein [Burkholderiales bacterium]
MRDAGRKPGMIRFTESIAIKAPPNAVWALLSDITRWWLPSNPAHARIEVRAEEQAIDVGTEIAFEERAAGIRARAEGTITQWIPGVELAWAGTAVYRHLGFSFPVREGATWRVERRGETSRLVASVWTQFRPGLRGRLLEWYVRAVLNAVRRDRAHTRCELAYLRNAVEEATYHTAGDG